MRLASFVERPVRRGLTRALPTLVLWAAAAQGAPSPDPDWVRHSNHANAAYGTSVASAGDVDGDGYTDILVGVPYAQSSIFTLGRAELYRGGPGGVETEPAWTKLGPQHESEFGWSVSGAGDVNGDGYDDVLIGAPGYDGIADGTGRVELYYGSASGLSSSPDWTMESEQADCGFGRAVAGVGDINGDGRDDVAVGAPYYTYGQTGEGRVFVYRGSPSGLPSSPSHVREWNVAGARFGHSVAWAGDVNADGYDDLVIGVPYYEDDLTNEGMALLYLGTAGGLAVSPSWIADGGMAGANFGTSVSGVGDVNGDGYGDLAIGAPLVNDGQILEGRMYVYHGRSSGVDATPANWFDSNQMDALMGGSVAPAGDFDGDGYADVAVGIERYDQSVANEGSARIYYGGPTGVAGTYRAFYSGAASSQYGHCVTAAGDVNGDGRSDFLVGAPGLSEGQTDEGGAFVYHGVARALRVTPNWTWSGENAGEDTDGLVVTVTGDWNGDSISDLAVGDPNRADYRGRVRVFYGTTTGLPASPDITIDGPTAYSAFGAAVANAGDIDGDGYNELAVGAPGHEDLSGGHPSGHLRIYSGGASGVSLSSPRVLSNESGRSLFGFSVACAGDVNADGFADLLVGEPNWSVDRGRAYLYLGADTGLSNEPSLVAEGTEDGKAGYAVGSAGDVDGDGFDDWLVGSPTAGPEHYVPGRVDLFYGAAEPDADSDFVEFGLDADAHLGTSVAALGDVDHDGRSEFAVGAPGRTGMGVRGRVAVFGSVGGRWVEELWYRTGEGWTDEFSARVAAAGDVNGDGLSDLLVGAPYWTSSGTGFQKQGRAYLYLAPFNFGTTPAWELSGSIEKDRVGAAMASGDFDGDGHIDIAAARQPDVTFRTPDVRVFHGSDWVGPDRRVRQLRLDVATPISVGGGTTEGGFWLQGWARHPVGRAYVSPQYELETSGAPFDGADLANGGWFDTGTPTPGHGSRAMCSVMMSGLEARSAYHWRMRMRTRSRWVPYTPWITATGSLASQSNVRMLPDLTSDAPWGDHETTGLQLQLHGANPVRDNAQFALTTQDERAAALTIHDVSGRAVRMLHRGPLAAGSHQIEWNLRNDAGAPVPSGIYFARLESGSSEAMQRVVVLD